MEWLKHIEDFLRKSAKSDIEDLMQVRHQTLNKPLARMCVSWHPPAVCRGSCRSMSRRGVRTYADRNTTAPNT